MAKSCVSKETPHLTSMCQAKEQVHFQAGELHELRDALKLQRGHAGGFLHAFIGFGNGGKDLRDVEDHFCSVSFDDFH